MVVFLATSFGLSTLLSLPLWFWGGMQNPYLELIGFALMWSPAIAALLAVLIAGRPFRFAANLGLWPVGNLRRFLFYLASAAVMMIAFSLLALIIPAYLGLYPGDILSVQDLIAMQLVGVLVLTIINVLGALGEEIGWRGWLLPRLMHLGTIKAILITGIIWGLFHAPFVLLGQDYPGIPPWAGVLMKVGSCIVLGGILGWLRIRSGSVWPAAIGHSALNSAAGLGLVFLAVGGEVNAATSTTTGWAGWIAPAVVLVLLVATQRFRPKATASASLATSS